VSGISSPAAALLPTYRRFDVTFVRGSGARLWDSDGNEYIDLLAGIATVQLGHCHPAIVAALERQARSLWHVSNFFYNQPMVELAERLVTRSLGGGVFFTNSGAEAIECALKLARRHRPRGEFVVLEGGFHGRTFGALSATPQPSKQEPFAPLVPGVRVVPRDDPERLAASVDERCAAVLVEPIQGEGGVHPLTRELLAAARAACDRSGALLVFDEVQCGIGRTGSLFAYQHEDVAVTPDVVCLAKGLGGGFPIGACVVTPALRETLRPGDHGSTFGGNALACAVANAVLDVVDDHAFLARVRARGERLRRGLAELGLHVRGRGLMLAFALDDAPAFVERALHEARLVLNATGPDTVRLVPPLVIEDEEIDSALARIASLLGC
jgi:acetylornithine/N-succinyldiaminopimelate aminotransferase